MNLEQLQQRRTQTLTVTLDGHDWVLGKIMGDTDPASIFRGDTTSPDVDKGENLAARKLYARLLKACVLNGSGLMFANQTADEVEQLLTWRELFTLGQEALAFNGLGENAKKN